MTDDASRPDSADAVPADLATTLGELARSVEAEPTFERTLEAIVEAAAANIPGVENVGISLVGTGPTGTVRTVAPSDEIVTRVDKLQYKLDEGPCVDAISDQVAYRTGDLAKERRWPRFGQEAADMGVTSMLSFRLFTADDTLGALNLYSARPDAFGADAVQIGGLFAVHAAIALAHSRQETHLMTALDSRDVIGMAKGILMERHRIDDGRAFSALVAASQRSQKKLHEVARWLVAEAETSASQGR